MDCSITASEREYTANHTNEERKALTGKFAQVQKLGENVLRRSMIRHVGERDQDSEESEDVEDKDESFKSWKQFSANRVDTNCKQ